MKKHFDFKLGSMNNKNVKKNYIYKCLMGINVMLMGEQKLSLFKLCKYNNELFEKRRVILKRKPLLK